MGDENAGIHCEGADISHFNGIVWATKEDGEFKSWGWWNALVTTSYWKHWNF